MNSAAFPVKGGAIGQLLLLNITKGEKLQLQILDFAAFEQLCGADGDPGLIALQFWAPIMDAVYYLRIQLQVQYVVHLFNQVKTDHQSIRILSFLKFI